ncbi:MAG: cell division ATPase MinD [archaeon]|nr:MAG: cell division ATPase MinD [archaeon]
MGRIITFISGKGGVGKTTLVSNTALVLNELGKDTIAVDGNVTTPNLSMHLGIPLYPITLHDVLRGEAKVKEATYIHPTGLKIIPGSIGIKDLESMNLDLLDESLFYLAENSDYVLVDGAAGLGREAIKSMEIADDIVIATNPDLPSVTEALKVKNLAESFDTNVLGVVLNRITKRKTELTEDEIKSLLELPILGKIPEDPLISQSIHKKIPIVNHKSGSPASIAIKKFGANLAGEEPLIKSPGLFNRIANWLSR